MCNPPSTIDTSVECLGMVSDQFRGFACGLAVLCCHFEVKDFIRLFWKLYTLLRK